MGEQIDDTCYVLLLCCISIVSLTVCNGDMMDICPYCKVKGEKIFCVVFSVHPLCINQYTLSHVKIIKTIVIPGGSLNDSTFMSGIVFSKNVNHRKMAKIL